MGEKLFPVCPSYRSCCNLQNQSIVFHPEKQAGKIRKCETYQIYIVAQI